MFWKKTDDFGSDFGQGYGTPPPPDAGMGPPPGSNMLDNDPYTSGSMSGSSDPFRPSQMPPGMGFSGSDSGATSGYPSPPPGFSTPSMPASQPYGGRMEQMQPSAPPQQHSSQPSTSDRSMDLLISKLDQIKMVLESINARLQNMEQQGRETERRW